jgi:hypothetical protein
MVTITIVACPDPDCGAPATISARWTWPSTDGPVEHVQTLCLNGHCYTQAQPKAAAPWPAPNGSTIRARTSISPPSPAADRSPGAAASRRPSPASGVRPAARGATMVSVAAYRQSREQRS